MRAMSWRLEDATVRAGLIWLMGKDGALHKNLRSTSSTDSAAVSGSGERRIRMR
jgi:hypothetical protein